MNNAFSVGDKVEILYSNKYPYCVGSIGEISASGGGVYRVLFNDDFTGIFQEKELKVL